ncbi:hypothetical protein QTL86_06355 [Cellulosilyticum sp. ST5]|uniref:hypothetical protein n=1 Tax=Cellulosilyticum sp. ST5 TaxID=3055805 RepID=UPI003977AA75
MEKSIKIADKLVALKTTGATLLRYKMQFGKDLLTELIKLEDAYKKGEFKTDKIDFELFFNILWIMAKTANPDIKPPVEWLDEFEEFPVLEILPKVIEMLSNLIGTAKKKLQK